MRAPSFWKERSLCSTVLLPLAALYGAVARLRACKAGKKLPIRVICVGNAVAGGAGKTPVALALASFCRAKGINAHFLTRGYKSNLAGPVQVDTTRHTAQEVGDEPLLLARMLPTWMAKDRLAGAYAAVADGAQLIIMDDGFQNPALHKDISLLVVDGGYGFGNGRLLPAGPLRESVASAAARAKAVIVIGEDEHGALQALPPQTQVLRATLVPTKEAQALKGKSVVAFAGIGRPRKFYRTLQALPCAIKEMISYPDHHFFTDKDMQYLRGKAKEHDATLVTTTKDYARLSEPMRAQIEVLPVEAVFEDPQALAKVLAW